MSQPRLYRIGWRAHQVDERGNHEYLCFGSSWDYCMSEESARRRTVRRVPAEIGYPDADIGILYVEGK